MQPMMCMIRRRVRMSLKILTIAFWSSLSSSFSITFVKRVIRVTLNSFRSGKSPSPNRDQGIAAIKSIINMPFMYRTDIFFQSRTSSPSTLKKVVLNQTRMSTKNRTSLVKEKTLQLTFVLSVVRTSSNPTENEVTTARIRTIISQACLPLCI